MTTCWKCNAEIGNEGSCINCRNLALTKEYEKGLKQGAVEELKRIQNELKKQYLFPDEDWATRIVEKRLKELEK